MSELWSVFFSQEPVGATVNTIITLLFLIGCWDVWSSRQRLSRELNLVKKASQRVADGEAEKKRSELNAEPTGEGSVGETAKNKGCPAFPPAEVLSYLGVPEGTLLGRRVFRTIELRKAGLGQRSALQSLTLERVEGYGALARYLATILTILGLLGTVFGLTLAMFRIQGAFTNVNSLQALSQLTQALGGTLEGMKTAFGCTMAGLLGAVLLSALNHNLRRYQSRVVSRLEEFVTCELLPAVEVVDPEANEAAKAFANTLAKSGEQMESVGSGLTAAATAYKTSSELISGSVTSLQNAVKDFSESLNRMSGDQKTFTETMQSTKSAVETLQKTLDTQLDAIRSFSEKSHELLETRLKDLENKADTNQQLLNKMGEYHTAFTAFVEKSTTDLQKTMKESVAAITKGVASEVQQLLAHEKKGVEAIVDAQRSALRSFSDMMFHYYGLDGAEAKRND